MKRSIGLLLAAAAIAALVVVPLTARAGHQTLADGNDTPGRLDLRSVETWGAHTQMGFRLTTFRRWTPGSIWDSGFFVVNVDTFGGARTDCYALIRSDGRRMEGLLFRDRVRARDYVIRRFAVWRPNARSVSFRFPWASVRIPEWRQNVTWSVVSILSNDACPNVCFDNVPNQGVVATRIRPAPEPTPTIAPTETPET